MEVQNKSVTTPAENNYNSNNNRILEWESGLPSPSELPSITQSLMSPELSLLFGITPKPLHVLLGINQLSSTSVCCRPKENNSEPDPLKPIPDKTEPSDSFKRRIDAISGGEEASNPGSKETIIISNNDNNNNNGDHDEHNGSGVGNRAVKRPRLVWTPQLHKRFVDVIEHLGVDKAVPKTIMEMMNVEGLTRENVASHLQKYRLYLKRVKAILGDRVSLSKPSATATVGPPDNDSNGCGAVGIIPSPTIDVEDDQCPPPPNNGFNLGGSGDGNFGGRQVAFRQELQIVGYCNSVPPLIMPLPRVMGTGTAGAVGSGGYTSYGHLGMPTSAAAAGGTSLWD